MNIPHWESDLPEDVMARYSRQVILSDIGVDGQQLLCNSSVLVVGLGGLGSPLLMYLCAAGVGTIGIVDYDTVELHNLQRQVIHGENTIGRPKVGSAREFLARLNTTVKIVEYPVFLNSTNAREIIKAYDVVADCCDDIQLRYTINDWCRVLNKDLVCASVLRWEGQVCVIRKESPCYRCMFPVMKQTAGSCAADGVLGPVCGVVGAFQATEIVKIILNCSPGGSLSILNCKNNVFKTFHKKHQACIVCTGGVVADDGPIVCSVGQPSGQYEICWSDILANKDAYVIIDIRKQKHFRMLRVSGSINMEASDIDLDKLRRWKRPVVVACYRGVSSRQVVGFLREGGIESYGAIGGIEGFKKHLKLV